MKKVIAVCLTVSLLVFGSALADRIKHETREVDAGKAQELEVNLEFSAGELKISPKDLSNAATLDMRYDSRQVEYEVDYEVSGGTGYLDIECDNRRDSDIDTDKNRLDLVLSTHYPTTLEMEIGACDAEIDLGGLPLERLEIEVGAASGDIDFSEPNPRRLEEISIDAGASSLDMYSIGNANFEELTFSGGAGSFDLDFRGEYRGESRIDIDLGLGSADIVLPRGIPIRVETEGSNWLSSVDLHGDDLDEIDDGVFESPDFDKAEDRIVLTLSVGLGSVDLIWKR